MQNEYIQKKQLNEAQKRVLFNKRMAVEKKREILEEKLFAGTLTDRDYERIKDKIEKDLSKIQDDLDEIESVHDIDMETIREILKLTENIYETYKKAPYMLKRHFLGLFWEKFLIQDKRIVRTIPNKLIENFCEYRGVIINDEMSRE